MVTHEEKIPPSGYKFPLWDGQGHYRTTALAYMKREGLIQIEHNNGRCYTLQEIENAIIK